MTFIEEMATLVERTLKESVQADLIEGYTKIEGEPYVFGVERSDGEQVFLTLEEA